MRVRLALDGGEDVHATETTLTWFDMTGDMMKLQQQFFATMLAAGNTDARTTTKL